MRQAREIIIAPMVTEKTGAMNAINNSYTFRVSINANKLEIQKAIEKLFDVHVKKINTIRQRGKVKSMSRYSGKRPDWKKAIVKLQEGDSIPDFDL